MRCPKTLPVYLCAFLLILCACSDRDLPRASVDLNSLSGERALSEAEAFAALGPKSAGTDGAAKAASYLESKLKGLGLNVSVDEFSDDVRGEEVTFRNVIALLGRGGGNIVILMSHYDTKSGIGDNFVGANDSASSTGLLLELAEVLKGGAQPPFDVMFAFLDGEECRQSYGDTDGLHGSRRLAGELKRSGRSGDVQAVILVDMIGDKDLTLTLPRNCSPELLGMVFDAAREEGVRRKVSLYRGDIIDDHVPFLKAGMPAVDIIDFEYGSSGGANDYWHTSEDTIDKLSADSLRIVGRLVLRMVNRLMN